MRNSYGQLLDVNLSFKFDFNSFAEQKIKKKLEVERRK